MSSESPMKEAMSPQAVGVKLKALRDAQNISPEELSKRTGVSVDVLTEIENGTSNPTVAMVWRIAHALDASLHDVLGSVTGDVFEIQRADNVPVVAEEKGAYDVRVVSPIHMVGDTEIYMINFYRQAEIESKPHIGGAEELLTVVKGTFTIKAGDEEEVLHPGDSARYAADRPHTIALTGGDEGTLFLVVKFRGEQK